MAVTDPATEIASLKQSLAEAEGQIRHLEQRLSEATEILDAVLTKAARREECGDAHFMNPESFEDLEPVIRASAFLAKTEAGDV
jgi:hypothetical protein